MHQYSVYILKCADNTLYTGITNELYRRFDEHEKMVEILNAIPSIVGQYNWFFSKTFTLYSKQLHLKNK
jgi:hypothetical protein